MVTYARGTSSLMIDVLARVILGWRVAIKNGTENAYYNSVMNEVKVTRAQLVLHTVLASLLPYRQ
ncbi:hypothetical protein BSQ40_03860 [Serratia fonticola]|nr:hypothetical protein BSQ40_03860 [Serratia fonticola]